MPTRKRTLASPADRPAHVRKPARRDGNDAISLLLVEDNHADVRLVREALSGHDPQVEVSVAYDGGKALVMLREAGDRPDLILLDLNLPRMTGNSLLGRIKADPQLRRIPVVVLTSSDNPAEVRQAYDMHANCYLVKPLSVAEFEVLIRRTVDYWTGVVRLPDGCS